MREDLSNQSFLGKERDRRGLWKRQGPDHAALISLDCILREAESLWRASVVKRHSLPSILEAPFRGTWLTQ